MFVDPKVSYDINGNSSFQLLFQRQSVDPSENFRELKKTSSPPISCLLDVDGSSDQKRTWQFTSSNIPGAFFLNTASSLPNSKTKNDMTKNYQPQRWLPSISPPKKTFGSILLSTPPVENIRKLSLWKKHAGFFTASGCFPPSPGPKKNRVPRQWDLCGFGSWMAISRALLGCLGKNRPKVQKLHGNLGKHPAPKRVLLLQDFQHRPFLMNPNESHE